MGLATCKSMKCLKRKNCQRYINLYSKVKDYDTPMNYERVCTEETGYPWERFTEETLANGLEEARIIKLKK